MHLEDRIKNGMTFYEHGHTDPIDIEQEKELEAQRRHCKICFLLRSPQRYPQNQTLLSKLL